MNILIFSEQRDQSTSNVIGWLSKQGHNIYRINQENSISQVAVEIQDKSIQVELNLKGEVINLSTIDSIWYRRGQLKLNTNIQFSSHIAPEMSNAIYSHLFNEELETLKEFINAYLYDKPKIGDNNKIKFNKLIALKKAKEAGLKIPFSEIHTQKEALLSFYREHGENCISKGIQDILSFAVKNVGYHFATSKINSEDLVEMDNSFFPSLLQEYIDKKYELRIFYLKGRFFSMAIFSQNDEKTKIDFRNYNDEKPNRNVPFLLPSDIQHKLEIFMQSMQLGTGSIDMIVTKSNEYIFLEVNPKGQYGMVSVPCGYHLDYEIANELITDI